MRSGSTSVVVLAVVLGATMWGGRLAAPLAPVNAAAQASSESSAARDSYQRSIDHFLFEGASDVQNQVSRLEFAGVRAIPHAPQRRESLAPRRRDGRVETGTVRSTPQPARCLCRPLESRLTIAPRSGILDAMRSVKACKSARREASGVASRGSDIVYRP